MQLDALAVAGTTLSFANHSQSRQLEMERVTALRGKKLLVLIFLQFLFFSVTVEALSSTSVKVDTKFGVIQGRLTQSARGRLVANFLGIPYAYPPLGQLRFRSPVAWNLTWDTPYYALSDSLMCAQFDTKGNIIGSEDCLYLNVFVPLVSEHLDKELKLPVLVFVHGGAFNVGSSDSSKFAPDYFMDQDVILVTLNYRLNAFGFFSTGNKASPGNYGLKDTLTALHWVHDNIENFHGDPNSVTLFGQSAGAVVTHLLALTNKTEGLFHRYILHSASATTPWGVHTTGALREASLEMASILGCRVEGSNETISNETLEDYNSDENQDDVYYIDANDEVDEDEETMKCMRNVSAKRIVQLIAYYRVWRENPYCTFGPTVEPESEDALVTMYPINVIKEKLFRDIPWIIGVVEDEGLIKILEFYTDNQVEDELTNNFELYLPYMLEYQEFIRNSSALATLVEDFYFAGNATARLRENVTELTGDALIIWPVYQALKYQSALMDSSSYFFLFAYEGTFSYTFKSGVPVRYGITHGDDLNYLFPILNKLFSDQMLHNTEDDTTIINIMTEMWASFATDGVPRAWAIPKWPNYKENQEYLRIGFGRSSDVTVENSFLPERMAFWKNLTEHLVIPIPKVPGGSIISQPNDPTGEAFGNHPKNLLIAILVTILLQLS